MKKTILITAFVLLVFCRSVKVTLAAPSTFPWGDIVQQMINTSITPVTALINSLQSRVSIIESNIAGIFSRLTSLENMELGPDFNLPPSWIISVSPTNQQISISSSRTTGNTCSWNGVLLTQQVTIRGIAHLPDGDVYAVGTCDSIVFKGITNFPSSGTNIPVDLHLFWQGKLKHTQLNITIP